MIVIESVEDYWSSVEDFIRHRGVDVCEMDIDPYKIQVAYTDRLPADELADQFIEDHNNARELDETDD